MRMIRHWIRGNRHRMDDGRLMYRSACGRLIRRKQSAVPVHVTCNQCKRYLARVIGK